MAAIDGGRQRAPWCFLAISRDDNRSRKLRADVTAEICYHSFLDYPKFYMEVLTGTKSSFRYFRPGFCDNISSPRSDSASVDTTVVSTWGSDEPRAVGQPSGVRLPRRYMYGRPVKWLESMVECSGVVVERILGSLPELDIPESPR